jgi:hypothetical protein
MVLDLTLPSTSRRLVWLQRYVPAELGGTPAALLCAWVAGMLTGSVGAMALAGTWGENLAYYGTMLTRDLAARDARSLSLAVRDLILEFGPAEVLCGLLVRPILLYFGMLLTPNQAIGIVVGKIAADILFYALIIFSYERLCRRRRLAVEEVSG